MEYLISTAGFSFLNTTSLNVVWELTSIYDLELMLCYTFLRSFFLHCLRPQIIQVYWISSPHSSISHMFRFAISYIRSWHQDWKFTLV